MSVDDLILIGSHPDFEATAQRITALLEATDLTLSSNGAYYGFKYAGTWVYMWQFDNEPFLTTDPGVGRGVFDALCADPNLSLGLAPDNGDVTIARPALPRTA